MTYDKSADAIAALSPEEYRVTQENGTERPFTGKYNDSKELGIYVDIVSGEPLFASTDKFDSGCGWPSFWTGVEDGALTVFRDASHGMVRTEMRCSRCDGHMGHIFEDAPLTPTGKRHCVNGQAILHVPEGEDPIAVFSAHRAGRGDRGQGLAARLRRLVERREEPFDEDRGAEEDGLQSAGQADHERDPASSGVKGLKFELSHPQERVLKRSRP